MQQIRMDAARFGIPAAQLMAAIGVEEAARDFAIFPENEAIVDVFVHCRTQWRLLPTPAGVRAAGLDYAGVESVIRMHSPGRAAHRREIFAGVQKMEAAAMDVLNG